MPKFKDGETERLAGKFVVALTAFGLRLMTRAAVHVSSNMIVPGGLMKDTDPDRVTTRSGRLLRSILGSRGVNWTGPESIKQVVTLRAGFRLTVGTKVPYAGVHEKGANAYTVIPSLRARKFFWAMYSRTRETKWRSMALAKTLQHKSYKGRPFMAPAIPDIERDIPVILHEELAKEFPR